MKRKIKKIAIFMANIRYRVTILTFFILIFYIIGLWKFSFFDNNIPILDSLSSVTGDRLALEQNIKKN